jgi:hypothetical protein
MESHERQGKKVLMQLFRMSLKILDHYLNRLLSSHVGWWAGGGKRRVGKQ